MNTVLVKLPVSKDEAQISAMSLLNTAITALSKRDIYIYTDMNEVHNTNPAPEGTRTYYARVIADFVRPFEPELWQSANTVQCIAGITGGNPTRITIGDTTYRAVCMTSGIIWVDKYPEGLFNGENSTTIAISTSVKRAREVSLMLADVIKSINKKDTVND